MAISTALSLKSNNSSWNYTVKMLAHRAMLGFSEDDPRGRRSNEGGERWA